MVTCSLRHTRTSCISDVNVLPQVITYAVNDELCADITVEEAWAALKHMHPSKAPGPVAQTYHPDSINIFGV